MGFHHVISPKGKPKHKWPRRASFNPNLLHQAPLLNHWRAFIISLLLLLLQWDLPHHQSLSHRIKFNNSLPTLAHTFNNKLSTHLSLYRHQDLQFLKSMVTIVLLSFFSHPFVPYDAWVIDTRATHHVCCNISLFSHSRLVHNTTIILPNQSCRFCEVV